MSTPARRRDIEALRVASAFGIVWFHALAPGFMLAYGGLVAFIVLSVMLGSGAPLRRRAARLLHPWLAWSLVYAAVNLALGQPPLPHGGAGALGALLAGPSIHLWYLPFMFAVLLTADALSSRLPPQALAAGAGTVAVALIALAPLWRPITLTQPYPLLQWADAAAPVAVGLFARGSTGWPPWSRHAGWALLVLAALAVAPFEPVGLSYAVGLAAGWAVASARGARAVPIDPGPLAALTLGIYLVHPLVLLVLARGGGLGGLALPCLAFAVSAAVAAGLRRWPRARGVLS